MGQRPLVPIGLMVAWSEEHFPMPKADARWHYGHKKGRIIHPWYPPTATVRRAGPAPRQSSTIELPLLVQVWVDNPEIESMGGLSHYPSVMWWHRWGRAAVLHSQPLPFSSMTGAGGRAGLVVIRVGKLYLTPFSCYTSQNWYSTMPGQDSRVNSISTGMGEHTEVVDVKEWDNFSSVLSWHGHGKQTLSLPSNIWARWESWP